VLFVGDVCQWTRHCVLVLVLGALCASGQGVMCQWVRCHMLMGEVLCAGG
jgi:hypothetical protein